MKKSIFYFLLSFLFIFQTVKGQTKDYEKEKNAYIFSFTPCEARHINGIILGFLNITSQINGVQIGVFNLVEASQGFQLGLYNNSKETSKGIQLGLINRATSHRGFQIGLWNINEKRSLPFINWQFKGKKSE